MNENDCEPKTVQWHQISLLALQQYVWDQFRLTEARQLSTEMLQRWVTDLHTTCSPQTGGARAVNTIAAYTRSGRAFCNWLVRQGSLPETPFPKGQSPKNSAAFLNQWRQRSLPACCALARCQTSMHVVIRV